MAQISDNYENYREFLGGGSLDAASGTLFNARTLLKVDTNIRVIMIGIGGAGLNTINYVKGMLNERMVPTWSNYIAFLAIDADGSMLNSMKNITSANDFVSTTRAGADARMIDANRNPQAVRHSMNPPLSDPALKWFGNGSGQRRLMGRAKLHDKEAGGVGVDEEIVNKLKSILGKLEAPADNTEYAVYIVGSVCGGTCSGAIQDMPALVRHALEPVVESTLRVYGMIYVPDAMVGGMKDATAKKAMANGYAALKEINYYQGMTTRPGYESKFAYNDPTCPEIVIDRYFDNPMLIGSSMGATADADKLAQQTVAEYLINAFAENKKQDGVGLGTGMTLDSILHNKIGGNFLFNPASNQTKEAVGEAHDFPYAYGAIGFAKAAAPQKIVIAYAVDSICKMTGIKAETRNGALPESLQNGALPTFKDTLFTAQEGTLQAKQLIQPLAGLLDKIHNGYFNFAATMNNGQAAEWKKINAGEYAATMPAALKRVDNVTDINHMKKLKEEISAMYEAYVTGVNAFVKQYGPMAYVNVYQGNFIKEGENTGLGVKDMMTNMMRGYNLDGSVYQKFKKLEETQQNFQNIERIIRNTKVIIGFIITEKHRSQAGTWQETFNKVIKAAIDEKRHEVAIGTNKFVDECICRPASLMAEQMEKFAHVLNGIADIYAEFGRSLSTYEEFSKAKDNLCEINIAAEDMATYNWLKNQVDSQITGINTKGIRDELIDDFMKQPESWLDNANAIAENGTSLKNKTQPIAARTKFDSLISNKMGAFTLNVSIEAIFTNLAAQGRSYADIAQSVINKLRSQSKVQFNGEVSTGLPAALVMIPASLKAGGGEGTQIHQALIEACNRGENVFTTDDADGIMMYNCVNELPIYRLKNLRAWESAYLMMVNHYHEGLHGLSPAVEEVKNGYMSEFKDERMPWRDYPALVVEDNPQKTDKDGKRSHEGDLRCKMDEKLKLAEDWGIISYQKRKDGKWICIRTYLDKSREWTFDVAACGQGPDGLLPTGEELMEEIMSQNGMRKETDQDNYKKIVALAGNAALMCGEYATEELARTYVPRILRAHVPMYLEILNTLEKFCGDDGWGEEIDRVNREIVGRMRKSMYPGMFVRMLMAGTLVKDKTNVWKLNTVDGKPIVLLNEGMTRFLRSYNKVQATSVKSYYLYKTIKQKLGEDYEAAGAYADTVIEELMNNAEMETLEANLSIAQMIMEEAEGLTANGAVLDDPEAAYTIKFKKYLDTVSDNDEEKQDMVNFYSYALAALTDN